MGASTGPSAFEDTTVMATSNPLARRAAEAGTRRPKPSISGRVGPTIALPVYLRAGLAAAGAVPTVGMTVVLRLTAIEAHGDSAVTSPSVVKVLCPAPFELSDETPTAARATFDEKVRETSCTLRFECRRASALAHAHLLVKCAIARGIKGHCVVPLRPLVSGLDDAGTGS